MPWPAWSLLGILLMGLVAVTAWRSSEGLSTPSRVGLFALRFFGVAGLWILLTNPQLEKPRVSASVERSFLVLLDTSASMAHEDGPRGSRWQQALDFLEDGDVLEKISGVDLQPLVMGIDEEAIGLDLESLAGWSPTGENTDFKRGLGSALDQVPGNLKGALLISDGHDFSSATVKRVASMLKQRRLPLHVHGVGEEGRVRDASMVLSDQVPFLHMGQQGQIRGHLRVQGMEFERVQVRLHREGKMIQFQNVEVDRRREVPVQFYIREEKPGQVEYSLSVAPVEGEVHPNNNRAFAFVNIVQRKVKVLLLEGAPHWDTTFLQRSLMANEKFDLDTLILYAPEQLRRIRNEGVGDLQVPKSRRDFEDYDMIILGQNTQAMLSSAAMEGLQHYLKRGGGILVFARPVNTDELPEELQKLHPALLEEEGVGEVSLVQDGQEGGFEAIEWHRRLEENPNVPRLTAARKVAETRRLVATLAQAVEAPGGEGQPALLHRRVGRGQVLSVGVDGLWKWSFHRMVDGADNAFSSFWDQISVWLITGGSDLPGAGHRLHLERTNLSLGQEAHFAYAPEQLPAEKMVIAYRLEREGQEVARGNLEMEAEQEKLSFSLTPAREGRHELVLELPDRSEVKGRFSVVNDDRERLELDTDHDRLRAIAQASGGHWVDDMDGVTASLKEAASLRQEQWMDRESIWDHSWVLCLLVLLLATEWFLRRRWGLW